MFIAAMVIKHPFVRVYSFVLPVFFTTNEIKNSNRNLTLNHI